MNSQALFSVAYLGIVSGVGVVHDVALAWSMAALTAGLAFLAHEVWAFDWHLGRLDAANVLALLSWVTGVIAGVSLFL